MPKPTVDPTHFLMFYGPTLSQTGFVSFIGAPVQPTQYKQPQYDFPFTV